MEQQIIGILGSGKGSNMASIAEAIDGGRLNARIGCVISDVEGAGILDRAEQLNIPAFFISGDPYRTKLDGDAEQRYLAVLREHGVQLVALAGFMRILKKGLLDAYPDRIINIHPSLLPAFPGLAAWEQALDDGAKVTGCTVHFVDTGTDTGRVILQKVVHVADDDTPGSLHARIQEQEHLAYPEALGTIIQK